MTKIKVAMICHFSNAIVQEKLKLKVGLLEFIVRKMKKQSTNPYEFIGENSVWIKNAVEEYEKMTEEIELHVIVPHNNMAPAVQEFELRGVFYHFFQDENAAALNKIKKHFNPAEDYSKFQKNRRAIKAFLNKISPDIVYMIGIESPFYSLSYQDIPQNVPFFVQLQTLLNDPDFEKNYPISHKDYVYRSLVEAEAIKRADYIGIAIEKMKNIIKNNIKPDAVFLNTKLAVGEKIYEGKVEKNYDFVYYAANINKAFDLAIEGFALALKKHKGLTLLVVGAYDDEYKRQVDDRIRVLGVENFVTFTGRLPTHDDVLKKIREARYALIPLKIDIVSGTIRESMANGLPVVTTITNGGTPQLNEERETVLLSPIGDHQSLADNMLRLVDDQELACRLRENGFQHIQKYYSNEFLVRQQKDALLAAVDNFRNGIPLPQDVLS